MLTFVKPTDWTNASEKDWSIEQVLKESGTPIMPIGVIETSEKGRLVVFENLRAMNARYYAWMKRRYPHCVFCQAENQAQVYEDDKLVGIVMLLTADSVTQTEESL